MGVAAIGLFWLYLGQTVFFVGPSEWDDAFYAELATGNTQRWAARNRYVHVWSLRLLYSLIGSRRFAAGLYPNLVIVALSVLGFMWGKRLAGNSCGLLAAALMPLYLAFLKWITVPYVDPTLALWATCTLLATLLTIETVHPRRQAVYAWCSGMACYLAVESKETGLAILPVVFIALLSAPHIRRVGIMTCLGVLSGWLVLRSMDAVFSQDTWVWWSSDWNHYFGAEPGVSSGKLTWHDERMNSNYILQLTKEGYLPFTLLGFAGAAHGFRQSRGVRILTLWLFSTLLFSSIIAWKSPGIFANERYLASFAPALVILSAYWITKVWQEHRTMQWREAILGAPLLVLVSLPAIYTLSVTAFGQSTKSTTRAVFFLVTLTQVFLFMIPWFTKCRWLPRIALVILIAMAALINVSEARAHIALTRGHLQPWLKLTSILDREHVNLVRWNLPKRPYATYRIRYRLVTLSHRPSREISVRNIRELSQRTNNEWVFSLREKDSRLEKLGWLRVVHTATGRDGPWSVYRPPT
ncbi:MAG: glycosyltransferase family 39 protein [Myxococcales bacterium]|nr:glycosyltransferase family 39 protein [Myxococcales bacterium]